MNDTLILVGRVLIAMVFLMTVWTFSPTAGYLGALGFPAPTQMSWLAMAAEFLIVISFVLGAWTRYGALLGIVYVIIAAGSAHRYWEYPQAQQLVQYIFFSKDVTILGGLILLYVTGAGAYSVDHMWPGKRGSK